ncbi:MAG TPA: AI-2E family transporter [Kribbella sp.]|nr:AI-2E family transporter [Kribbella sp.]
MSLRVPSRTVLVLVAAAALTISMAGLRSVAGIVGPAFLALVLTITVHPLRILLRRFRLPDWLASTLMVIVVYLLLLVLSLALVVSLGRLAGLVPQYRPKVDDLLGDAGDWLAARGVGSDQVQAMLSALDVGGLVSTATSVLSGVLGLLSDLFFIVTLLLFMAFDATSTTRVLAALRSRRAYLVDAMISFARSTRKYLAVSATFGLIVAVVDSVALVVMGVPGAFVWGVLAFVTNFIPNVGFVIGVVPPAIIGLLEGGPGLMVAVIAVYSVINFVIQSIIQPRVVGDAVGLSATITFLSLVFWSWAIGPLGALLAVPLSLLAKALLIEADPDARWALPLVSGKLSNRP